MQKNKVSEKIYIIAVVIASLSRVLLQMGLPICYIENSSYDDMLLIDYSDSILEGSWLGTYCDTTLNKVPFFSIFLACISRFNIPYMLAIGFGYTLSCLLFLKAIEKMVPKAIAFLLYIYLLYSPVMLDSQIAQRVYRNSIIPMLILTVISCSLIIYQKRNNKLRDILPWSIISGIAFSAFDLTREDSVWFYPFILGFVFLTVLKLALENKNNIKIQEYLKRIAICLIPVFMCILSVNVVKLKNYKEYGVYVTTDFKDTSFAEAGKNILKIKSDENIDQVWVTRSTIEKLYSVSPCFATLQLNLDNKYVGLDQWGTGTLDGEIEKDYIIWAIRWSARDVGVYNDARTANSFWNQVNCEIVQAFDNGELEKNNAVILSNLAHPLHADDLPDIMKSVADNFMDNIQYINKNCKVQNAVEYTKNANLTESITGNNVIQITDGTNYVSIKAEKNVRIANYIIKAYQLTGIWIAIIASVLFVFEFFLNIVSRIKKQSTDFSRWFIKLGFLLTVFCDYVVVSLNYFDAYNRDGATNLYTAGTYPLWQAFVCMTIIFWVQMTLDRHKNNLPV